MTVWTLFHVIDFVNICICKITDLSDLTLLFFLFVFQLQYAFYQILDLVFIEYLWNCKVFYIILSSVKFMTFLFYLF